MIGNNLIHSFNKSKSSIRDKYELNIQIGNELNIFNFEKILYYLISKNNHTKIKSKNYHLYFLNNKELIVFNDGSSVCLLNKSNDKNLSDNNKYKINIKRYKRLCNDDFESCIKYDKVTKNQEIIFMYKKWNIILSKITENNVSIYSCNLILDNVITKEKFRQLNLKITKILKVISGKIKI